MKLYFSPGACSLSPHIVLSEAGIKADLEQVDLKTKKTKSGADFTAVNPKGQVPTLVLDSGQTLTEGPAIVQYLADQKPQSGLAPQAGTFERYRLQEWLNYITSELHKSFGWYDFTVQVGSDASFERQLAGHVETGRDSMTDPAIG